MGDLDKLNYDAAGLIPAIVQDERTLQVLMLAFMSRESLEKTLSEGETYFWSRSRQTLWHKGETSGNRQKVEAIIADCDQDALLIKVDPAGPACHTGAYSCFFNTITDKAERPGGGRALGSLLEELYALILARRQDMPEGSYTAKLFAGGMDEIAKKVGEEAVESLLAAKNRDRPQVRYEVADLLYHLLVLLVEVGVTLQDIYEELAKRRR